jgi:hypothetical protein
MNVFDDIKIYLPKYLSAESLKVLFSCLEEFPHNLKRIYTESISGEQDIFQGDGLRGVPVIKLPEPRIEKCPVMVLSNTCDTTLLNPKWHTPRLIYCPIKTVKDYEESLRRASLPEDKIANHLADVRRQVVSSIFYLPQGMNLPDECVVLLDHVNNCDVRVVVPHEINSRRLFSLSNYGFYVFLMKLSIHFTRVRESVDRG